MAQPHAVDATLAALAWLGGPASVLEGLAQVASVAYERLPEAERQHWADDLESAFTGCLKGWPHRFGGEGLNPPKGRGANINHVPL